MSGFWELFQYEKCLASLGIPRCVIFYNGNCCSWKHGCYMKMGCWVWQQFIGVIIMKIKYNEILLHLIKSFVWFDIIIIVFVVSFMIWCICQIICICGYTIENVQFRQCFSGHSVCIQWTQQSITLCFLPSWACPALYLARQWPLTALPGTPAACVSLECFVTLSHAVLVLRPCAAVSLVLSAPHL